MDTGDGWKYYFKPDLLDTIEYYEDENEPAVYTFTYTYDYGKLTSITSGNNTVLTINYSATAPTSITAGTKTATLSGTPSKIDSVTTFDGQYLYEYDNTTKFITSVEDDSGKEYRYTYNNASKVSSVAEYYSNTRGDSVYISYANKRTTFMTAGVDDSFNVVYGNIYTIYCFDNYGRTVNVYNESMYTHELFSAIGVIYGNEELFPKAENNIRQIYRSDYGTHHMLLNPGAEEGTGYWNTYNATATNNEAYIGNKSFKVEYSSGEAPLQGVGQAVTLNSGKQYVLSAYVKIQNVP